MITGYCITNRESIAGRATNCFFSRVNGGVALAIGSTTSTNLLERRWLLAILPLQLVSNLDRLYSKYIQILRGSDNFRLDGCVTRLRRA